MCLLLNLCLCFGQLFLSGSSLHLLQFSGVNEDKVRAKETCNGDGENKVGNGELAECTVNQHESEQQQTEVTYTDVEIYFECLEIHWSPPSVFMCMGYCSIVGEKREDKLLLFRIQCGKSTCFGIHDESVLP